jgi:hypothetical protein
MNFSQAKKLAEFHKYTKLELYTILKDALEKEKPEYWKKPNTVNRSFTNGFYFNLVLSWIKYEKGVNDDELSTILVAGRVLQTFSKYSKHLPAPKKKLALDVCKHQEPILNQ